MIENQKKKIDNYENTIKEFCKIALENGIVNELSEECKEIISSFIDFEEIDVNDKKEDLKVEEIESKNGAESENKSEIIIESIAKNENLSDV